jgi:hypothetical protein
VGVSGAVVVEGNIGPSVGSETTPYCTLESTTSAGLISFITAPVTTLSPLLAVKRNVKGNLKVLPSGAASEK